MPRRERDNFVRVRCPSCFEEFEVAGPAPEECPTEWDYDCEICCRPMVIAFFHEPAALEDDECGDEIVAEARSLDD